MLFKTLLFFGILIFVINKIFKFIKVFSNPKKPKIKTRKKTDSKLNYDKLDIEDARFKEIDDESAKQ